jgi:HAD superfamily hydrolase (TIGR01509 family)
MDGTIVDTEEYWINAEMQLANAAGGIWTHEDGLSMVGRPIPVAAAEMQERAGLTDSVEVIVQKLIDSVDSQMREHGIPWRPGALELLKSVSEAGIYSAIVTMSYKQLAKVVMDALPPGYIKLAVTGEIVSHGKPHPEPYLMAARLLEVAPESCIAFEDSLTGLLSAEAAGTKAVGIPYMVPIPAETNRNRAKSLTQIGWLEIHQLMIGEQVDLLDE